MEMKEKIAWFTDGAGKEHRIAARIMPPLSVPSIHWETGEKCSLPWLFVEVNGAPWYSSTNNIEPVLPSQVVMVNILERWCWHHGRMFAKHQMDAIVADELATRQRKNVWERAALCHRLGLMDPIPGMNPVPLIEPLPDGFWEIFCEVLDNLSNASWLPSWAERIEFDPR